MLTWKFVEFSKKVGALVLYMCVCVCVYVCKALS